MRKSFNFLVFLVIFLLLPPTKFLGQSNEIIYHMKIDGSINPSTHDYIKKAIQEAKNRNANCLIRVKYARGLLKSTRYIVRIYQHPVRYCIRISAAQAGSASLHFCQHRSYGSEPTLCITSGRDARTPQLHRKVTNDAAAFIRSLLKRNRR
jgi:membrane-bound ClpP family serine protease